MKRQEYRNLDAFEMDDGRVFVQSSRDRIPVEYVPARCEECESVAALNEAPPIGGRYYCRAHPVASAADEKGRDR